MKRKPEKKNKAKRLQHSKKYFNQCSRKLRKEAENIKNHKKTRQPEYSQERQPFKSVQNSIDVEEMEVDSLRDRAPGIRPTTEEPMEWKEHNCDSSQRPNIIFNFYF